MPEKRPFLQRDMWVFRRYRVSESEGAETPICPNLFANFRLGRGEKYRFRRIFPQIDLQIGANRKNYSRESNRAIAFASDRIDRNRFVRIGPNRNARKTNFGESGEGGSLLVSILPVSDENVRIGSGESEFRYSCLFGGKWEGDSAKSVFHLCRFGRKCADRCEHIGSHRSLWFERDVRSDSDTLYYEIIHTEVA